jgi:hypothetical protein
MNYTTRPISTWLGTRTGPRTHARFKVSYGVSEDLLLRELQHLRAKDVVLEIDIQASDLRLDGTLRANAKPQGPRVCLYASTKHGPLMMPCDTFTDWRHNVRAIALSLEALRQVDRYGCAARGEQYRGWTAIPASTSMTTRVEAAWQLLYDTVGRARGGRQTIQAEGDDRDRAEMESLFREAALFVHPDAGGSHDLMSAVNRARETILLDLGER